MRQNLNGGADGAALVKIDGIFVEHADAAAGRILADAARLQGAVETIAGIDAVAQQVHGTGTERVLRRTARHEFGQFRMALAHLRWWRPARPERFLVDRGATKPFEALAADADAITDGCLVLHDHVEKMVPRIDNNRADRLAAEIFDDLAAPLPVDLVEVGSLESHAIVD